MKSKIVLTTLVLLVIATACVTINVYFPEAAAEQAATTLISDVLGQQNNDTNESETSGGQGGGSVAISNKNNGLLAWDPMSWLIPSAHAQDVNIDINTGPILAIRDRMRTRQQGQLRSFFESGAIGFTNNGLIEIRDRSVVSLAQRNQLTQLVNADNTDRNAIYREIAVANGHPEWEGQIRNTFARRWVELAPAGWYYQNNSGQWQQSP